jgi:histone acetyltransferase (RNA polymerase elongator complex component)
MTKIKVSGSKVKHYIIPIFVPHQGCPFKCVFCDQKKISGSMGNENAKEIIEEHLKTLKGKTDIESVEVAFYGGSFTAIETHKQLKLLSLIKPYIMSGLVDSIRLSTRPDFIDQNILDYLKQHGVKVIELGVQSMDDKVLKMSGRGHNSECVYKSAQLIKKNSIKLGIQLMPGLPGDNAQTILETTNKIIKIRPDFIRIYPTVVIKGTELEEKLVNKQYQPLNIEETVKICAEMYMKFKDNNIKIIRLGLQSSKNMEKMYVVAGPYHPAFGELVINKVSYILMEQQILLFACNNQHIIIEVPTKKLSKYLGQKRKNVDLLREKFYSKIDIIADNTIPPDQYRIITPKYKVTAFQKYF